MGNYNNRRKRISAAKNFNKYGILPGRTYGNYKVIESIKVNHKVKRKDGHYVECMATKWRCIYIPTGEEKITTTGYLSEFKDAELEKEELDKLVNENKHQLGFRNHLYRSYKRNAKLRNHEFNLTQDEFELIIFQDCYYCGAKPKEMSLKSMEGHGNMKQPPLLYNGIDRIDSDGGYTKENCVPCCQFCNYMKHTLSQKNFLERIKLIYTHLNLGSTTIEQDDRDIITK